MNLSGDLKQLEESLLTHAVRSDAHRVSGLLTDDFREFGSSGRIFSKREIIVSLQEEKPSLPLTMTDFETFFLSEGVVLVTYRTQRDVQDEPASASLRSSLWVTRDGRWQMLFHQGTTTAPTAEVVAANKLAKSEAK